MLIDSGLSNIFKISPQETRGEQNEQTGLYQTKKLFTGQETTTNKMKSLLNRRKYSQKIYTIKDQYSK